MIATDSDIGKNNEPPGVINVDCTCIAFAVDASVGSIGIRSVVSTLAGRWG